jgi:hypothetical protein
MTVSIGVAVVIGIAVLVLVVISDGLEFWTARTRRQAQRERWNKSNDAGGR